MSSLKPADDVSRALAAAARYVRTSVRSTHELRAYLHRRGVSPDTAARVVTEGERRGWVDDRACARLWAEQWSRQGYAWAAIRLKLSAKGLHEHTIKDAANRLGMSSDDEARARLVAASYLRRHKGRPGRQAGRLARTLASRGFGSDLIERVLNESFGSPHSDAER